MITSIRWIVIEVIMIFALVVIAFAGGMRTEYWRESVKRDDALTAQIKTQNDSMTKLIDAHNQEQQRIDAMNTQTLADQIHTQLLIQAQNNEIQKVQHKIATIHVGNCTFNSNADSVLDDAYKAAFPATNPAAKN